MMTILYVKDQKTSADFYKKVFGTDPVLDVPGMTEFALENTSIGLMPEKGIKSLLGVAMPDPANGSGIPRAEIYLKVNQPDLFHKRALEAGAKELSPLSNRSWGDEVAYSMDLDGHVLAFAKNK